MFTPMLTQVVIAVLPAPAIADFEVQVFLVINELDGKSGQSASDMIQLLVFITEEIFLLLFHYICLLYILC